MKRLHLTAMVLLIAFSFISGFAYQDVSASRDAGTLIGSLSALPSRLQTAIGSELTESSADLPPVQTFWDVFSYVEANYYGDGRKKSDELCYAAISGMLGALGDRYTRFLDPDQNKQMQEDNRGDFEGIGAKLEMKESQVRIAQPLEDSPAKAAGIRKGDVIIKVDGKPTQGLELEDVVKMIRGPRGTSVTLTIKRIDAADTFEVTIVRKVITSPIVEWRVEDESSKIGYIQLSQFNEKSDLLFDKALTDLESKGMRGLILDLRGNPGGLLDVAIEIGSRLIDKGDIVVIQDKGGRQSRYGVQSQQQNHRLYPLVVLIDGSSASASEIIAGAIQDHKAGTLVGTDSFGKGKVQTIMSLPDGCAVVITTAKYFTPSLRDVDKLKIHPDVVVEPSDDDIKNDVDSQLNKAVEILKTRLSGDKALAGNGAGEKS
ncbi:MAG: S41 family peptidase [Armatimonadetes bacterium]|nr:S41 family peptidase [Armatimonadota bacterium]